MLLEYKMYELMWAIVLVCASIHFIMYNTFYIGEKEIQANCVEQFEQFSYLCMYLKHQLFPLTSVPNIMILGKLRKCLSVLGLLDLTVNTLHIFIRIISYITET